MLRFTRACVPHFRERGFDRVINVTSSAAPRPRIREIDLDRWQPRRRRGWVQRNYVTPKSHRRRSLPLSDHDLPDDVKAGLHENARDALAHEDVIFTDDNARVHRDLPTYCARVSVARPAGAVAAGAGPALAP
jgi:hypothetical protein